ncbi:Serine/threonine-protein kinase PknB [BD1-7 clade bacterium]|uniref:Serine/threonine-protein kinase PknB n=1 Tax=BD1-7 clade bacterium TaxID=2029982 RepID=A0A5S9Q652_9GAMM|nr:Serine/threonine-protein kinase PknB [BD1-7 clade bacterium]
MASNDSDETVLYRPEKGDKVKSGTRVSEQQGDVSVDVKEVQGAQPDSAHTRIASTNKPPKKFDADVSDQHPAADQTRLISPNTRNPNNNANPSSATSGFAGNDATVLVNAGDRSRPLTGTSASAWQTQSSASGSSSTPPKVINNRFVLGKSLGAGGMGAVYKAKDIRKVEARDRNPWVAVKLLNNAFKEHPDAFISLQREARKTQGLAHPNIVRVYDFDREGDTVYMTMELLEGRPVDKLIKENPGGLEKAEAFQLIRELGGALSEAHKVNIIHSDFKPGNIFYTDDKVSKVFDFGIARAVSGMDADDILQGKSDQTGKEPTKRGRRDTTNTTQGKTKSLQQSPNVSEEHRDDTLFDAGELGALTPTYASYEMLKGMTPSASDDLYALGCVAYELLTGKHPYARMPADKARDKKLRAPGVKDLNRREQRALKKAVAFRQEDRYVTVDEFLHDFLPENHRWKRRAGYIGALVLVGGAAAGWNYWQIIEERTAQNAQLAAEQRIAAQKAEEFRAMQALMGRQEVLRDTLSRTLKQWQTQAQTLKSELDQQVYLSAFADSYEWQLATTQKITDLDKVYRDEYWLAPYKKDYTGQGFAEVFDEAEAQRIDDVASTASWITYFRKKVSNVYIDQSDDFIAADDLDKARDMFQLAKQYDPDGDPVAALEQRLNDAYAEREAAQKQRLYRQRLAAYKKKDAALLKELDVCASRLAGNGQANSFDFDIRRYGKSLHSLNRRYKSLGKVVAARQTEHIRQLGNCIRLYGFSDPNGAREQVKIAKSVFPDYAASFSKIAIKPFNTCKPSFSEKGRRYTCQDRFVDQLHVKGPKLVVVPANTDFSMFAMGKYEVSRAEWNRYCEESGACSATGGPESYPITDISSSQIGDYLAWLTEQTGFVYQLPTHAQWLYAAEARGSELDKNRNCSMSIRGINKGMQLVPATMGQPNRWGLINHVGNAQEWVKAGNQYILAGASRLTPMDECQLDTVEKTANMKPDVTGFRVMRIIR